MKQTIGMLLQFSCLIFLPVVMIFELQYGYLIVMPVSLLIAIGVFTLGHYLRKTQFPPQASRREDPE